MKVHQHHLVFLLVQILWTFVFEPNPLNWIQFKNILQRRNNQTGSLSRLDGPVKSIGWSNVVWKPKNVPFGPYSPMVMQIKKFKTAEQQRISFNNWPVFSSMDSQVERSEQSSTKIVIKSFIKTILSYHCICFSWAQTRKWLHCHRLH